jgi:hypothetical protein
MFPWDLPNIWYGPSQACTVCLLWGLILVWTAFCGSVAGLLVDIWGCFVLTGLIYCLLSDFWSCAAFLYLIFIWCYTWSLSWFVASMNMDVLALPVCTVDGCCNPYCMFCLLGLNVTGMLDTIVGSDTFLPLCELFMACVCGTSLFFLSCLVLTDTGTTYDPCCPSLTSDMMLYFCYLALLGTFYLSLYLTWFELVPLYPLYLYWYHLSWYQLSSLCLWYCWFVWLPVSLPV